MRLEFLAQHDSFMPHGMCYLWKPEVLWLHVIADATTAAAYYAIPPALLVLVLRTRREAAALGAPIPARRLPYEWMFLAFGLFIIACGTTHVLSVLNVWVPRYWVSGAVKAVTALASIATAIALPPLVPRAVALFREARLAEMQRTQLAHLAAIVESSHDAILTKTTAGIITTWNRGAEELYGYRADEVVGKPVSILVPPDRPDEVMRLLRRIIAGERVSHFETERIRRDGTRIHVSLTLSPVYDARGTLIGVSTIARDITERRRVEEQALHLAQAQEANRAKSEFLAVMSHELRTPLNAIVGYADLLQGGISGPVTEAQSHQLGRIEMSARHLRELIDQVLVFNRGDAGAAPAHPTPVALRDVLQDVVETISPMAAARSLELDVSVDPADLTISTDPMLLRQVLLNLAANAVKFTERGSVALRVEQRDGHVEFLVADTGPGIAQENLERIFEPFWQVERGHTRAVEGAGLGLAVSRRLARQLGGDVTVESAPGRGSRFCMRLPIDPA